ncbi:MAG: HAMP domain-containing sensor histidine kinase [Luteolibacter sp.]|uniref:sensor histidine kinase n=1 Tax=Luteolibacter sp. TaxID=1962973 RepID=UPI0032651F40
MGKSPQNKKPHSPAPWWWTAALFCVSAAFVAGAGVMLSKRTERISVKPPGNHPDDNFRQIARRVDEMEQLWQTALEDEAKHLLASGSSDSGFPVSGVIQASRLAPNLSDPARAHHRADGAAPAVKPVLEKFARKEPGEWVFKEDQILSGSGWIEMPDRPPAWWQGDGRSAVILLLDPNEAAAVVAEDLKNHFKNEPDAGQTGILTWEDPTGKSWMENTRPAADARPDEILRHVSRFGDWTLRRFYPVRITTSYRLPVLLGGFTLSALLLGGGIAIVSWQRKATRLAEQRVSFVNRVSHELRTPLTNLLLNTDLALDSLPVEDGKVRRRLGLIREETSRLSRIVDNVQTFARIERGKSETRTSPCNVEKVVFELRENFAPLFARKSIRCEYDCQLTGEFPVDRDAFSQILSNLLSNVEKYAGESAKARVVISCINENLLVEVDDSGSGIPHEARNRIFMPFERVGSRVDEGATGTGLGLAISRDLAVQMGGRLELIGGAKFRLTIPCGERSPA